MAKRGRKRGDTKLHAAARKHTVEDGEIQGPTGQYPGKLASDIDTSSVRWLWFPWIPFNMLSLVVGNPCVGKSTFIAALVAYVTGGKALEEKVRRSAGRVVLLPGHEEDLEVMTVPRLEASGARLENVKILDEGNISLLHDRERIARTVEGFSASLLVGDPIDSYVPTAFPENEGAAVRDLLEAASWIAREARCAVLFARHPGKDQGNVMPGSRAWRAVPRSIVQLTTDGNIPPRYLLSHYKDSLGTHSTPCFFTLDQKPPWPPVFRLGEYVEHSADQLAKSAGGPTGRYKLMLACRLIRWAFEEEHQPTRVKLGEEARKQGIGEDTVADALRLLMVRSLPPLKRGDPWNLHRTAEEWPSWLLEEDRGVSHGQTP